MDTTRIDLVTNAEIAFGQSLKVTLKATSPSENMVKIELMIGFNPQVLTLNKVKSPVATVEVDEATFLSGQVIAQVYDLPSDPGEHEFLHLFFTATGEPGDSTNVVVGTTLLQYADGSEYTGMATSTQISIQPESLIIDPTSPLLVHLPAATTSEFYCHQLTATGGVKPLHWHCEIIPDGLKLSPDGYVSGWLKTLGNVGLPGIVRFEAEVTDSANPPDSCATCFEIPVIAGPLSIPIQQLETAILGRLYSNSLDVRGGTPPCHWQLIKGNLPSGIQLQHNGELYGWAQETGNFQAVVRVTDALGQSAEATITIKSRSLYGRRNCAQIGGANAVLALPNLVRQSYELIFDIQRGGLANPVDFQITLDHNPLWFGKFKSGENKIVFESLGGPHLLGLRVSKQSPQVLVHGLTLQTGAKYIRRGNPFSLSFAVIDERTNSVISEGYLLGPNDELLVPILMPGSADDLLIARSGSVQIRGLASNGVAPDLWASDFNALPIDHLVWAAPGLALSHQVVGRSTSHNKLVFLKQDAAGNWSSSSQQLSTSFSTLTVHALDNDQKLKTFVATSDCVKAVYPDNSSTVESWSTKGTLGYAEDTTLATCNIDNNNSTALLASNYYASTLVEVKQGTQLAQISLPKTITIRQQYDKTIIAVASNKNKTIHIFSKDWSVPLKFESVLSVGYTPTSMLLADLTANGKPTIFTADSTSNILTAIVPASKGYSIPEYYAGPEALKTITAVRGQDGNIRLIALGTGKGELVSWNSANFGPACQIVTMPADSEPLLIGAARFVKQQLLIGNASNQDLNIYRYQVLGSDTPLHLLNLPEKVPAHSVVAVDILLEGIAPKTTEGQYCAEIFTNDPLYPSIFINLASPIANHRVPIDISSRSIFNGWSQIGNSISRKWTLCNANNEVVTIKKIQVLGSNAEQFEIQDDLGPLPWNIQSAGNSIDIRILFRNRIPGILKAVIIADCESSGVKFSVAAILESLVKPPPKPKLELVSPQYIGKARPGQITERYIAGSNQGDADLIITGGQFTGPGSTSFELIGNWPVTVPPVGVLASTSIRVRFKPKTLGHSEAILTLRTNDPNNIDTKVFADATADAPAPSIDLQPQNLYLSGSLTQATTPVVEDEVTLTNSSSTQSIAQVNIKTVSGLFEIVSPAFPLTLGSRQAVLIRAIPPSIIPANQPVVTKTGFIDFTTNDPNHPTLRLNLSVRWQVT